MNKLNLVSEEEPQDELLLDRPSIMWQKPFCVIENKNFTPDACNVVLIELDGRMKADLNWDAQIKEAKGYISQGKRILWLLNLGLFSELPFSLLNQAQLQTLSLAVEHFNEKIWNGFSEVSLGVCLYRGPLDFSAALQWDDQLRNHMQEWVRDSFPNDEEIDDKNLMLLYTNDICMDYLDKIMMSLKGEIEPFALLDAEGINDPLLEVALLHSGRCLRLRCLLKNSDLFPQDIVWEGENTPYGCVAGPLMLSTIRQEKPRIGLLVPKHITPRSAPYTDLREPIRLLKERGIAYRLISEELLTVEWDGLDQLIVFSSAISKLSLRMLQGFCAAGGEVITVGEPLHLPQEMTFSEWTLSLKM